MAESAREVCGRLASHEKAKQVMMMMIVFAGRNFVAIGVVRCH